MSQFPWITYNLPGSVFCCSTTREWADFDEERLLTELRRIHPELKGSVQMKQIHGSEIRRIEEIPAGSKMEVGCDGIATNLKKLALVVKTADCVPVVLYDPQHQAIMTLHAGWRGLDQRMIEKGVQQMQNFFQSRPEDLHAIAGPFIHSCCYPVSQELFDQFDANFPGILTRNPNHHLDLDAITRCQMQKAGILPAHMQFSGVCTSCRNDLFASFRREGDDVGRIFTIIWMK